MVEFISLVAGVGVLALIWTLYSMKRDGYFGKSSAEGLLKKSSKRGSIVFFKDGARHVK